MRVKKALSLGLLTWVWMASSAAADAPGQRARAPETIAASPIVLDLDASPATCPAAKSSIGSAVSPALWLSSGLCACSQTLGCAGVTVGTPCTTPIGKPGHCFAVPRYCSPGTDTCRCQ